VLVRFAKSGDEAALGDALRTLSALDWTNVDRRPGVVAYLPCYFGNPYQGLLYSDLPSHGLQAVPIHTAKLAAEFTGQVASGGVEVIVHVHWLNAVTKGLQNEAEAREAAKAYVEQLQRAKDLGARVLWTVHNILPHDSRFEDVDIELRRAMTGLADRVHLMSPGTRELVAPWFEIPEEKTFVVAHPGYQGAYPSWMSRDEARLKLGIGRDATVFLMIGAIKAYKGLTELITAFDELSRREPGRYILLVAGQPDEDQETQRFVERAMIHPAILGWFRRVREEQMQLFLRAADIGVYPYRRSLNSGALALGLTFGVPAVVPAQSGEARAGRSSYLQVYDAANPDGLLRGLSDARRLRSVEARAAALAAIELVSPRNVARAFGEELRRWIA
jgi:beta-1,4-mannosyltransferase